jgi:hypothetical protein
MRISSPGRTKREGGFVLLDAILATLILLVGIAATMLTIRTLAGAAVRQAERLEQTLDQRSRNAEFTIIYTREE